MIVNCPRCRGEGFGANYLLCEECNGVGQIPLPTIHGKLPTGRQLLWGAVLCAAVVVGLILMFASKL